MVPTLLFSQLLVVARVLLCLRLHVGVANMPLSKPQPPRASHQRRRRSPDPQPLPELRHQPLCAAGEQAAAGRPQAPGAPPPIMPFPRGRRRRVDPQAPCWPAPHGASHGWRGRGHRRAHGPPGGPPWRPPQGVSGAGSFAEPPGTLLHGPHVSPERIGRVLAWRAKGLGLRGPARGGEIDPKPVLRWWVEAAEQRSAFAACWLRAVPSRQGPRDAPSAVRRAVRDGTRRDAEASVRLARALPWGWTARDPETPWLRSVQGGERPRAMAPVLLHAIAPLVAPGGVPLLLRAGAPPSLPARVPPCGPGGSRLGARPQARRPRPAGGRVLRGARPQGCTPGDGSGSWRCSPTSSAARTPRGSRSWPPAAGGEGTAPRHGGSGRSRVGPASGAVPSLPHLRVAPGQVGPGARRTDLPLARARPRGGGRVRRRGRRAGRSASGRAKRGGCLACHRGPSRRRSKKRRGLMIIVLRGSGWAEAGHEAWVGV
jgi:hypothetical protein